jgi:hypothetical protein
MRSSERPPAPRLPFASLQLSRCGPRALSVAVAHLVLVRFSPPFRMATLNTGVSGEYHVFSLLLRKGFEAYITVGSTKAIDLLYYQGGTRFTIDVKTSEYDADFILGDTRKSKAAAYLSALAVPNHFFVFVSYLGRISDHTIVPACYVVPAKSAHTVIRVTSGARSSPGILDPPVGINAKMKLLKSSPFLHAWHLL